MSPLHFLGLITGITALAAVAQGILRRGWEEHLRKLAATWGMNYSARDQLRLTAKVARAFPVPGAAHIKLIDLIYGAVGDRYRYIFTAEYTTGVVHGKRRIVRAGSFTESRTRDAAPAEQAAPAVLAPAELPLIEQYRRLAPPEVAAINKT